MEVIFNSAFAQVSFDEASNSVIAVWKKATTTPAYQETFKIILEVIKKYKASAFISDIYFQGVVGTENRNWMESEILPEAIRLGLRKIATIAPEDIFKKFYVSNVMRHAQFHNEYLKFKTFGDLISAQAWVMNKEVVL